MLDLGAADDDAEFVGCLRRIVGSEHARDVSRAWNSLEELENSMEESAAKSSTYDCNRNYDKFLRSILTEDTIRNVGEVPRLLEWFSKFPFPKSASNPVSNDIAKFLQESAPDFEVRVWMLGAGWTGVWESLNGV